MREVKKICGVSHAMLSEVAPNQSLPYSTLSVEGSQCRETLILVKKRNSVDLDIPH